MSRINALMTAQVQKAKVEVEGEVERMDNRPDHIDKDTWDLMQENGRLATERLNEILASPKFTRLRPSDQAKLIALAQNRAYGVPLNYKTDMGKRAGKFSDVTATALRELATRAALPEYKATPMTVETNDEDEI